ncbi:MAG TPA: thiamine pyrophosphate-binding protein [Burkholderiales bacterium]|nr:thiamine pyrophosphate-binding protein [Burkholderiales bacterium]
MSDRNRRTSAEPAWPAAIHDVLKSRGVRQVAYVPDAGHRRLIELCHADRSLVTVPLTSEEQGIGLAAGAWLGGQRAVLLTQSSGVGNCVNAFTLGSNCGFPLLLVVTMRGEWGEFNPWQIPMGQAVEPVLHASGVRSFRLERPEDAAATVDAAAGLAFDGYAMAAVLVSQKMLGAKSFAGAR